MAILSVTAFPATQILGRILLSSNSVGITAAPTTGFSGSVTISSNNSGITASPMTEFSGSVKLSSNNSGITAAPVTGILGSVTLSSKNASITATPLTMFLGKVNVSNGITSGMTVCGVVKEMLALWDIFDVQSAPDFAVERAVNDLNASLQMVWNHADDRNYWSSDTMTITLAHTESTFDLPSDIQNVVGPCRLASNNRPLVPLGTVGELETFRDLYLDGETSTEPLAYHINRMSQTGNDPAKIVFCVVPEVSGAATDFYLEVVRNAPRFAMTDMNACPVIPIPHSYVESLLLPIARYHASSFSLFNAKDLKDSIDRDYLQARVALGLSDPLPGKAGDNIDRRDEKRS